jgi:hypothetical protein
MLNHSWSRYVISGIVDVIIAYIWLKKYTFLPEGIFFCIFPISLSASPISFSCTALADRNMRGKRDGAYRMGSLFALPPEFHDICLSSDPAPRRIRPRPIRGLTDFARAARDRIESEAHYSRLLQDQKGKETNHLPVPERPSNRLLRYRATYHNFHFAVSR